MSEHESHGSDHDHLGERPVFSAEALRLSELTNPNEGWMNRAARTLTLRGTTEQQRAEYARQAELLLSSPPEHIDPKEIERAPLFEFGQGFEGHPPDHYKTGEKPVMAPMSKEEMRLLLFGSIPPPLLPMVMNNFVFSYSEDDFIRDSHERIDVDGTQGTQVAVHNVVDPRSGLSQKKVHINFNFNSFFNRRLPPPENTNDMYHEDGVTLNKGRWMTGFIDKSKINLIMGKIIAQMIEPPWNDEDKAWEQLLPKNFRVTVRRGAENVPPTPEDLWEDFVSLAIAHPEEADQKMPELYHYFQDKIKGSLNLSVQEAHIERLERKVREGRINTIPDFDIVYDLRTEEEKQEENDKKGISSQLAWYDKVGTWLNRWPLSLFGKRITFEMPEDPERLYQREKDKGEIAKLLEQYRCVDRDKMLGDVLQRGRYAHGFAKLQLKTRARQIIIANSQSDDFSEWRVVAYLAVFSDKFRQTGGHEITKEEYEDLRTIHNASAGSKRHGTDMMMYQAVPVKDPNITGLRYHYKLKPRAQLLAEIQHKVSEKSDDAINKMPVDGLDQCTNSKGRLVDFNGKFNRHTQDGMEVVYGNLRDEDMLGETLADEVGEYLEKMQIDLISPDTKEVLVRLREYIDRKGGPNNTDKALSEQFKRYVGAYGPLLIRPAAHLVHELQLVKPEMLVATNNIPMIANQMKKADEICTMSISGLEHLLEARDQTGEYIYPLHIRTKQHLMSLLRQGKTLPTELINTLMRAAESYIPDPEQRLEEQNSLQGFLFNPDVSEQLFVLVEVTEYQHTIQPHLDEPISIAIQELGTEKGATQYLQVSTAAEEKHLKRLKDAGIVDEKELDEAFKKWLEAEIKVTVDELLAEEGDIGARLAKAPKVIELFKGYIVSRADSGRGRIVSDSEQDKKWIMALAKAVFEARTDRTVEDENDPEFLELKGNIKSELESIIVRMVSAKRDEAKKKLKQAPAEKREEIAIKAIKRALSNEANEEDSLLTYLLPGTPGSPAQGTPLERFADWLHGPGRIFAIPPLDTLVGKRLETAAQLMITDPRAGSLMIEEVMHEITSALQYREADIKSKAPPAKK